MGEFARKRGGSNVSIESGEAKKARSEENRKNKKEQKKLIRSGGFYGVPC